MTEPVHPDDNAVLHALPFPALMMTTELRIIDVNLPFRQTVMREHDTLEGVGLFDAFPARTRDVSIEGEVRASVARALRAGAVDRLPPGRHDITLPDGSFTTRYWRLSHSCVARQGAAPVILQIVEDVTEQHVGEALQAARERVASKGANVAFWDVDLTDGTLLRSPAVDAMHGFAEGEAGVDIASFLERIHPDDRQCCESVITGGAQAHFGEIDLQYRVILPEGAQRWLLMQGEVIQGPNGRAHVIGMVIDVTKAHRNEEELRTALAAYRTLLNEVNHRVKNSLQMVASILNLESNRAGGPARAQLAAASARVGAIATIHAGLYLDDDVTRVEIERQITNLCRHLSQMADCARRGIEISVKVIPIRLAPDRAISLALVINELVSNALQHGFEAPGGGRVEVILNRSDDGSGFTLTVQDDGAGSAGTHGPAGLGGRLVRMAAEQFGGTISIPHRERGWATMIQFPAEP
ncbi:sensor histidine kinase [Profundibacterium mesophilum]|uniref:histidine kinase n=1 Tax=Profundibacterium mesophilum KAUST100406-0324 TaxID=1037889 RepID=A0A921NRP5_9RHOB|nr:histidine kinase dimerization/phosphoacceptor domain -containing protein [Profundibacterium mesophilum]KAF0675109.1 chemotaxis protein methyltransferase CheR [Profundibacterium mesophilum KAUST100406-0324]